MLTADEAGLRGRADAEQLVYASAQGRALYSFNITDYNRLHYDYLVAGDTHAGIILAAQQRYGVGEQMRRLLRIISTLTAEQLRDQLEFLSDWG